MQPIDLQKLLAQFAYNPQEPLLFNSGFFLFTFVILLGIYPFIYQKKYTRTFVFTAFSFYFAYKASGVYACFLGISAIIDFTISNLLYTTKQNKYAEADSKVLLIISLVLNLGLLAYFKYTNFFISIVNDVSGGDIPLLKMALPVAISFYTFENISYTIDVYRGHFKPIKSFMDYCFFLTFFPKLMMGPIVRAADFIPQIYRPIKITPEMFNKGLLLILGGLFKKVVISDYLTVNYVDIIFDAPASHTGIECLLAIYCYAMVIYCDFSGYSDMAIGMAKWFGFEINPNFNAPYQSGSITEFWRKWHMSLSAWLKDYLYISLGGNRGSETKRNFNLFATMLLGGLWHGAKWNFIIWGMLHGIALGVDKAIATIFGKDIYTKTKIHKIISVLLTFHFVCFCWVFFKSETLSNAWIMLTQIVTNFHIQGINILLEAYYPVIGIMALGYCLHAIPMSVDTKIQQYIQPLPLLLKTLIAFIVLYIVIQSKQSEPIMPIYLQF